MLDCLKAVIVHKYYDDIVVFWLVLMLKITFGLGITIVGTDFLIHVYRRKTIPLSKLSHLATAITIFYTLATWIQICQFPPIYQIYYSILSNDSEMLDYMDKACNIDLEHAVAVMRGIFSMFGSMAYLLTFTVYYIRLKASFSGSFYQITKCTTRIFWTIIA